MFKEKEKDKDKDKAEPKKSEAAVAADPSRIAEIELRSPEEKRREIAAELAVKSLQNWRASDMSEVMDRAAKIEAYLSGGDATGAFALAQGLHDFENREMDDPSWPEHPELHGIWQEGVSWALSRVGAALGIKNWNADGASESIEGDVAHEITSIFTMAKLYDPETGAWATLPPAEKANGK